MNKTMNATRSCLTEALALNNWSGSLCLIVFPIDNGTISPVIQTTNGSRVPSSRPRTDVRPKGKDTMSNAEHKVEQKR